MKLGDKLLGLSICFLSFLFLILFTYSNNQSAHIISSYEFSSITDFISLPLWIIYGLSAVIFSLTLYYSKREYLWVIALIFLIFSSSAMVYYTSSDLRGHDSWFHGSITQSIVNYHYFGENSPTSVEYPGYYLLVSLVSLVFNLPVESIMQVFTPLMVTLFFLILYLALRRWVDPKWAVLSVFCFFLLNRTLGDIFNPGLISMIAFVLLLYSLSFKDYTHTLISVLCIALIVTTHPTISLLSPLILLGLVFSIILVTKITRTKIVSTVPIRLNLLLILAFLAIMGAWAVYSAPNLFASITQEVTAHFGSSAIGVTVPTQLTQPRLLYLQGSVLQNYVFLLMALIGFIALAKNKNSRGFAFSIFVWLGLLEFVNIIMGVTSGPFRVWLWTGVRIEQFIYFPGCILFGYFLFYCFNLASSKGPNAIKHKFKSIHLKKILLIFLVIFVVFQSVSVLMVKGWYEYSQRVTDENISTWNFLKNTKTTDAHVLAFHPTIAFVGQQILQEFVFFGSESYQGMTSIPTPFYTANMTEYYTLLTDHEIKYVVIEDNMNVRFYDQFAKTTSDNIFIQIQNATYNSNALVYDNDKLKIFGIMP